MGHFHSFLAQRGGIWTKIFQKFKCPGGRGMFKLRFDWYISFCFDWKDISNTRDSVTWLSKHLEFLQKYSAVRCILNVNSLLGVWISRWNTVSRVWYITSAQKLIKLGKFLGNKRCKKRKHMCYKTVRENDAKQNKWCIKQINRFSHQISDKAFELNLYPILDLVIFKTLHAVSYTWEVYYSKSSLGK